MGAIKDVIRIGALIAGLATVTTPMPASAEEAYYFHRLGTSRSAYVDDVNYCAGLAGTVRSPDYQVYVVSSNAGAAAASAVIGAFFVTMMERSARRRLVSRIERTCMGDKGYARRAIDKATHRAILALEGEAKVDRMFALVAAEHPAGRVLVE